MIAKKKRILFVDDDPNFLDGIRRSLHNQRHAWDVVFAGSVDEALVEVEKNDLDVIVTDVKMPGKDGFKVIQAIHESERQRDVPVILLTGHGDTEMKTLALSLGAHDLLIKPVAEEDLVARLRAAVHLKSVQDDLKAMNAELEHKVAERTAELEQSRVEIIWRLAKASERRDGHSGNHILRVGCYARIVAETMGVAREQVKLLYLTAPLHDVGKIGIPDSILRKPGPLSFSEIQAMREHCAIGAEILTREAKGVRPYLEWLGQKPVAPNARATANRLLSVAASIAMTHHERWDGMGYPMGLTGSDIPIDGRITAIADVYDALCSDRPYKKAVSEDEAATIVKSEAGRHFDPAVVDAFDRASGWIRQVRPEFPDGDDSSF